MYKGGFRLRLAFLHLNCKITLMHRHPTRGWLGVAICVCGRCADCITRRLGDALAFVILPPTDRLSYGAIGPDHERRNVNGEWFDETVAAVAARMPEQGTGMNNGEPCFELIPGSPLKQVAAGPGVHGRSRNRNRLTCGG